MKVCTVLWFMLLIVCGDVFIAAFNFSHSTSIVLGMLWGAFVGWKLAKKVSRW